MKLLNTSGQRKDKIQVPGRIARQDLNVSICNRPTKTLLHHRRMFFTIAEEDAF